MKSYLTRLSVVVVLLIVVIVPGVESRPPKDRAVSTSTGASSIDRTKYIDANKILMFVTNQGIIGRDLEQVFGYDYGTFFPFTSIASIQNGTQTSSPLYTAGLWLGGMVNGQIRIAAAEYLSEFWPGPMVNHTYIENANVDPKYRVYKLYADSGSGNPNRDYLEWPSDQGAPTGLYGRPLIMGNQAMWSVFNDANFDQHLLDLGGTMPLGVEVQHYCWAKTAEGSNGYMVYHYYKLYNKGTNNISNFYIGVFFDPDLGGPDDDFCGADVQHQTVYCYNAYSYDAEYGDRPPAIGIMLQYGPLVPAPGNEARFFDRVVPNYRNMEMTAFRVYTNGTDPENATQTYNMLKGLTYDGQPLQWGPIQYTGSPQAATGDLDPLPDDKRGVASFGPLTFNPGDSQFVAFVVCVGDAYSNLTSITVLQDRLRYLSGLPTAVDGTGDENELPSEYTLGQNYPNPFNPSTVIGYDLPSRSDVRIDIYNVLGQSVRTLVSEAQSAGKHTAEWDGRDANGHSVASGVYLYRLQAGGFVQTKKMVLAK